MAFLGGFASATGNPCASQTDASCQLNSTQHANLFTMWPCWAASRQRQAAPVHQKQTQTASGTACRRCRSLYKVALLGGFAAATGSSCEAGLLIYRPRGGCQLRSNSGGMKLHVLRTKNRKIESWLIGLTSVEGKQLVLPRPGNVTLGS